jgi:hypothetical protein
MWNLRLTLSPDGGSLAVDRQAGTVFVAINTASWKISYPGA